MKNNQRHMFPRALSGIGSTKPRVFTVCLAISFFAAICPAQSQAIAPRTVAFADRFLRTEARGRATLNYLHFGGDYHGHEYLRTVSVLGGDDRPIAGYFALVYRFHWENDGITDLAYLCNEAGKVYRVQVMYTNAVFSQPFGLANAAIKVLGNALIEAYKNNMSDPERKIVQKLVDSADAKGLLEWSLKFEQPSPE
jgi:hypothetical protein